MCVRTSPRQRSDCDAATHIITAIHEMNDLATLGNLLSVEGAADVFW